MGIKQFDNWNEQKKSLDKRNMYKLQCHQSEIWTCKIGVNLGNEIGKNEPFVRPVIILNSYLGGDLVFIVPLTTQYKERLDSFLIKIENHCFDYTSYAMLNQPKVISKTRLLRKIGKIKESELLLIKKEVQNIVLNI